MRPKVIGLLTSNLNGDHHPDVRMTKIILMSMVSFGRDFGRLRSFSSRQGAEPAANAGRRGASAPGTWTVRREHRGPDEVREAHPWWFYGHFSSRDDLIAEALEKALRDGEESAIRIGSTKGPRTLKSFLNSYLSKTHRDNPRSGCAISALAGEVARADTRARSIMSDRLGKYFDNIRNLTMKTMRMTLRWQS